MAQKVNTYNLRLGNRFNWNVVMCLHNHNDYNNKIVNVTKLTKNGKSIFANSKIMHNILKISKSSKCYKLSCKLLNQKFFFEFVKLITKSKRITQPFYQYRLDYLNYFKNIFMLFNVTKNSLIFRYSNANHNKKLSGKHLTLNPFLFSQLILSQLSNTNIINLSVNIFNQTLQYNILKIIKLFLIKFNYKILGLKIICVGKWKKTKSGRKQKIYIKYGQIKNLSLINKISYCATTHKTKYGVCSIRVWISHS